MFHHRDTCFLRYYSRQIRPSQGDEANRNGVRYPRGRKIGWANRRWRVNSVGKVAGAFSAQACEVEQLNVGVEPYKWQASERRFRKRSRNVSR